MSVAGGTPIRLEHMSSMYRVELLPSVGGQRRSGCTCWPQAQW